MHRYWTLRHTFNLNVNIKMKQKKKKNPTSETNHIFKRQKVSLVKIRGERLTGNTIKTKENYIMDHCDRWSTVDQC
jgi:hypothetical protein